ncbi:hypothetical protein J4407_01735 [Candidatus Pacearchaeota archaeon]|nr:hypothetical protein [Candidatus Pacearchaeota archaeon]
MNDQVRVTLIRNIEDLTKGIVIRLNIRDGFQTNAVYERVIEPLSLRPCHYFIFREECSRKICFIQKM